jgi:hypothetical protein
MEKAIGFDELRWLQELNVKKRRKAVPELIGRSLLDRGLIEQETAGWALTNKGRIALKKLG